MLFTIARAGGPDFYDVGVLDAKTGKQRVLVHGISAQYATSGHLVYVTSRGTAMAAPFDLDRLAITGQAVTLFGGVDVRNLGVLDISLSTNGLLVYTAGANRAPERQLEWVTRDGSETPIDPQWTRDFEGSLSLSPDGKAVAVAARPTPTAAPEISIKQLDHGPELEIAQAGSTPTWSPDAQDRLRHGDRPDDRPRDGSTAPSKLRAEDQPHNIQFTRDGKWIVYATRGKLFAVHTNGDTARHPLVIEPGYQFDPVVSPDMRWLAFESDETGRREVYVRPFPDTRSMRQQISIRGGDMPRWSADGRELFYADEKFNMTAVPVAPGSVFRAGSPRALFPAGQYLGSGTHFNYFDVSSDGKRFIMSRAVGSTVSRPDDQIVVQNFFEQLRTQVPAKK